ncbi:hypothetical protein N1851_031139 [Merluccius polli]|uniref:Uncharacterized protein n=1 Tax=Merluccius polli TaxID=89951 RepID=A0AA47NR36_MERPO|nr:hypothetical protein N1851_031139 [Merluccius polli]
MLRKKKMDMCFKPKKHFLELADGMRANSVASKSGDAVAFLVNSEGCDQLIHKDGTKFHIKDYNRLYYLNINSSKTDVGCHACYDIKTWHEILGHCNYDDVSEQENVADRMKIKRTIDRSNLNREVCTQGTFWFGVETVDLMEEQREHLS